MKRILLFVLTNLAVLTMITILTQLLGVNNYLQANGINYSSLLIFSLIVGFAGSIFSLLISKQMAKWSMGLKPLSGNESSDATWLVSTINRMSMQLGIKMPEVCIYESDDKNAFATGPSKNNSLVAVSTGLLNGMNKKEVEAVLGHEMSHIVNGDMVTMTLLQGVLNTFVVFISRVLTFAISSRNENSSSSGMQFLVMMILQTTLGILASIIVAWYSRRREFVADKGGGSLSSKENMINALKRLGGQNEDLPSENLKAFGISGKTNSFMNLFASHPPIEERIKALQNNN